MPVDLVDDRQKVFRAQALAPVDLVHADGPHIGQFPVGQAPLHKPVHRPINGFPTRLERARCFPPREAPGPLGQKSHHGRRDRPLPLAPGNVFDSDAVLRTLHPPGRVEEKRSDLPQRHEEPRSDREPVVPGSRLAALSAFARARRVRLEVNVDAERTGLVRQLDSFVDETGEMLNPVRKGFTIQLNSWSPGLRGRCFHQPQT